MQAILSAKFKFQFTNSQTFIAYTLDKHQFFKYFMYAFTWYLHKNV